MLLLQKFRSLQSTVYKYLPGSGVVTEPDDFVGTEKDHIMITRNGTAPNGVDADFPGTGTWTAMTAIHPVERGLRIYSIQQRQRCAAGCICFPVVMRLHDFDIKAPEHFRRIRREFLQNSHAERIVRSIKHRAGD